MQFYAKELLIWPYALLGYKCEFLKLLHIVLLICVYKFINSNYSYFIYLSVYSFTNSSDPDQDLHSVVFLAFKIF